jgi:hypothetical protein
MAGAGRCLRNFVVDATRRRVRADRAAARVAFVRRSAARRRPSARRVQIAPRRGPDCGAADCRAANDISAQGDAGSSSTHEADARRRGASRKPAPGVQGARAASPETLADTPAVLRFSNEVVS